MFFNIISEEQFVFKIKILPFMSVKDILATRDISKYMSDLKPTDGRTYFVLVHEKTMLSLTDIVTVYKYVDNEEFKLIRRKPYIGYVRLSTHLQTKEYGFAHQREMINQHICKQHGVLVCVFEEIGSAKNMSMLVRPKLNAAIALCKDKGYTLITSKVDRLCRSIDQIIDIERFGVSFEIAELGTEQSRFLLMINASVAEEESRMISHRTKVAMNEMPTATHSIAITCGLAYWNMYPTANLTDVVESMKHVINPKTQEPYTYNTLQKLIGYLRPRVVDCATYLDMFYSKLHAGKYKEKEDEEKPQLVTNITRNVPKCMQQFKNICTIRVDRLSAIPLSSRLWDTIRSVRIYADDLPGVDANMYFKTALFMLPSEIKMREILRKGAAMVVDVRQRRLISSDTVERIHALYAEQNSFVAISKKLHIYVSTCEKTFNHTLSAIDVTVVKELTTK